MGTDWAYDERGAYKGKELGTVGATQQKDDSIAVVMGMDHLEGTRANHDR